MQLQIHEIYSIEDVDWGRPGHVCVRSGDTISIVSSSRKVCLYDLIVVTCDNKKSVYLDETEHDGFDAIALTGSDASFAVTCGCPHARVIPVLTPVGRVLYL